MLRLLKALPLTLAIAAVIIVATSCSSNNGTKARFVNAIQNTVQYGRQRWRPGCRGQRHAAIHAT